MKVDVQILIDALTTERTSIDRAISALRQITPTTPPVARATPVKHRRPQTRMRISDETKRLIVGRMTVAESRSRAAVAIAREFGMSRYTVQSGWQRWAKGLNQPVNGDTPVVPEVTHEIVQ